MNRTPQLKLSPFLHAEVSDDMLAPKAHTLRQVGASQSRRELEIAP